MWKVEPAFWFKQTLASVHGIPDYNLMSGTYSIATADYGVKY